MLNVRNEYACPQIFLVYRVLVCRRPEGNGAYEHMINLENQGWKASEF